MTSRLTPYGDACVVRRHSHTTSWGLGAFSRHLSTLPHICGEIVYPPHAPRTATNWRFCLVRGFQALSPGYTCMYTRTALTHTTACVRQRHFCWNNYTEFLYRKVRCMFAMFLIVSGFLITCVVSWSPKPGRSLTRKDVWLDAFDAYRFPTHAVFFTQSDFTAK